MVSVMQQYEKEFGVKITFSVEKEPLGTAGPLALARDILDNAEDEPFFVLNSDIICDFPFTDMLEAHRRNSAEGTILVTKVEEPSKYGVIVCDSANQIKSFVEKPAEFISNRINAGIYILSPRILARIQPRPTSIEKETFPAVAKAGTLFAFDLEGFWMDVGQPKDYLQGTSLYLQSLARKNPKQLSAAGKNIIGNCLIHPTARIGTDCLIGPSVVIGPGVVIEDGVRISKSVIFEGSTVHSHACVSNSIIGWNSSIGRWARVEGTSVFGEDVAVSEEIYVNGGFILPHKGISANICEPKIVM